MSEPFRFTWERAARSAGLSDGERGATTLAVALTLATYASPDGSSVRPGVELLAEHCGAGEQTVRRALKRLRQLGWITLVSGHGPNRAQVYRLTVPEAEHRSSVTGKGSQLQAATPVTGDHDTGHQRPEHRSPVTTTPVTSDLNTGHR